MSPRTGHWPPAHRPADHGLPARCPRRPRRHDHLLTLASGAIGLARQAGITIGGNGAGSRHRCCLGAEPQPPDRGRARDPARPASRIPAAHPPRTGLPLTGLLDGVRGSSSGALVLRGRAGMGKTALPREMAKRAASGGMRAHRARACSASRPAQELSDRLASSERLLHFAAAPNEKRPLPRSEPACELRFWSPVTESNRRPSPYHVGSVGLPAWEVWRKARSDALLQLSWKPFGTVRDRCDLPNSSQPAAEESQCLTNFSNDPNTASIGSYASLRRRPC
jgi:hypothetical protein